MDQEHARPGCGWSAVAGVGGKTSGSLHAPAVAGLRSPGREGRYLAARTPGCGRLASAGAGGSVDTGQGRLGLGRAALAVARGRTPAITPRLWLVCVSRGQREDTWLPGCPGCSRCASAGAGERTTGGQKPGCWLTPDAAVPCQPGRK